MLQQKIAQDIKTAMLAGDKKLAESLKMIKSAFLYKEVELGVRDSGLSDEQVIEVLKKEAKKRLDAAEMYESAGRTEQAAAEKYEHQLITNYLPVQMSEEDLEKVVNDVVTQMGSVDLKDMGKVIGAVKAKAGSTADGSRIAAMVKSKLTS